MVTITKYGYFPVADPNGKCRSARCPTRRVIARDRRATRLGITDSGRALFDEAFTTCLRLYESILEEFTPSEVKNFDALLEKLVTRLDELSGIRQPWGTS
jgi:hypothetical protein